MSTYVYLECLDHNPPLKAEGESGQHLYDLPQIRQDIANREHFNALAASGDFHINFGHHFRNNTVQFLICHPLCRIGIRDEYGREHPMEADDE